MGFSVLDGLPMGSRCGALDPGYRAGSASKRHARTAHQPLRQSRVGLGNSDQRGADGRAPYPCTDGAIRQRRLSRRWWDELDQKAGRERRREPVAKKVIYAILAACDPRTLSGPGKHWFFRADPGCPGCKPLCASCKAGCRIDRDLHSEPNNLRSRFWQARWSHFH